MSVMQSLISKMLYYVSHISNPFLYRIWFFVYKIWLGLMGYGIHTYPNKGESLFQKNIVTYLRATYGTWYTVLNIWSHHGEYAQWLIACWIDKTALHCFEPWKKSFQILQDTLWRDSISFHNFWFSDKKEQKQLFTHHSWWWDWWDTLYSDIYYEWWIKHMQHSEEVTLTTLDDFFHEYGIDKAHFISIDVEWHEMAVLLWWKKQLSSWNIEVIQFEFNACTIWSWCFFVDFYKLLDSFWYSVYMIQPYWLQKVETYEYLKYEIFAWMNFVAIHQSSWFMK